MEKNDHLTADTDTSVLPFNWETSGAILFVPQLISGNVCHCGSALWEQAPHAHITMFINNTAEIK